MDVQRLQQHVSDHLTTLRPIVDYVFSQARKTAQETGRDVNARAFVARLNRSLKGTRVRARLVVCTDDPPKTHHPLCGGWCYQPATKKTQASIRVLIYVHPSMTRFPSTNEDSWNYFRFLFLGALSHELVHRGQYAMGRHATNGRVFRTHPGLPTSQKAEQEYFGDIDEVEAYARDCVEEWHYLYPTDRMTLVKLTRDFRINRSFIATQYYHAAFDGDENHPAVKLFFKKAMIWHRHVQPLAHSLPPSPAFVRRSRFNASDRNLGENS